MSNIKTYEVPVLPEQKPIEKPSKASRIPLKSSACVCAAVSTVGIKCKLLCVVAVVLATTSAAVLAFFIAPCNIPLPPDGCFPLLSFSNPIPAATPHMEGFSYIVASDSQFPWVDKKSEAVELCATEANIVNDYERCLAWFADHSNLMQLSAARHLIHGTRSLSWPSQPSLTAQVGEVVVRPSRLVMNGDLTAFYHEDEAAKYESFFHARDIEVMPGLGNHDYTNNADDCYRLSFDANCCAKLAVDYMRRGVACNTIPNFNSRRVTSYDAMSMAYSWDEGNYHFVQLQYRPYYEDPQLPVASSVAWLEQDLAEAYDKGRSTVIFAHFVVDRKNFTEVLRDKGVVGVFHGHIHSFSGYVESYGDVPVFYSGSSSFNTFLLVEFRNNSFNVASIDASTGEPVYQEEDNPRRMVTVDF